MNLANKSFKNNKTGDVVRVIDSFEYIAILENKQKIDTRILMDPNHYTEQIDPGSFFNNQGAYNILAEKIKNIPTSNLVDDDGTISIDPVGSKFSPTTNEIAVVLSSEEDEKAELAKKYGVSVDNTSSLNRQNEAFAKLLGEEVSEVKRIEVKRDTPKEIENTNNKIHVVEVEDPMVKMFRGVKRNIDFNISIDINNKIPRLDFIEMMEDSYETSIIEFLSEEFTMEIINNPSKIKSIISEKIKSMINSKNEEKTKLNRRPNNNLKIRPKNPINLNKKETIELVEKETSIDWEKEPLLSTELNKKIAKKTKEKKELK